MDVCSTAEPAPEVLQCNQTLGAPLRGGDVALGTIAVYALLKKNCSKRKEKDCSKTTIPLLGGEQ